MKIIWLVMSCVLVLSLVLVSCGESEEKEKEEVIMPPGEEKEVAPPEEEEATTRPVPEPAAFEVSDINVHPLEVESGEPVNITVSVVNTGGTEGSYTVVLTINGVKEAEKNVTIAGGNTEDVTFAVTKEEAESYSVVADGLNASFTVAAPVTVITPTPEPPSPPPSPASGTWSTMTSGTEKNLNDVWGSSSSNVFIVGDVGARLKYNGRTWSTTGDQISFDLMSVWGSSPIKVFAVGDGTILTYYGENFYGESTWKQQTSVTIGRGGGLVPRRVCIYDIWGSSFSDVFAVGEEGNTAHGSLATKGTTIHHYDGHNWNPMTSGIEKTLYGVWGSSSSDVFAVGEEGTILHYDGNTWSSMTSGTTKTLSGIWGISSSDVFVIGDDGIILHYDGSNWNEMDSGTTVNLSGIWGSSSSDVFVVGANGIILHYDGSNWNEMDSGTTVNLSGIWGSLSNDVFVVGLRGTILHYE